jgi:hypothetical protein
MPPYCFPLSLNPGLWLSCRKGADSGGTAQGCVGFSPWIVHDTQKTVFGSFLAPGHMTNRFHLLHSILLIPILRFSKFADGREFNTERDARAPSRVVIYHGTRKPYTKVNIRWQPPSLTIGGEQGEKAFCLHIRIP